MDSNNKPTSGGKSQVKTSGPNKSHSPHPRQTSSNKKTSSSQKKNSRNRSRNRNPSGGSGDRRFQQRSDYRNNKHHLNPGYNSEYNRNNNYNPNRNYNPDWNRNTRPNRNPRWNNTGVRYGNLSWQRNNVNHYNNFVRQTEPSTNQICDGSNSPTSEVRETIQNQAIVSSENQKINSPEEVVDPGNKPSEVKGGIEKEDQNQNFFRSQSELLDNFLKERVAPEFASDNLRQEKNPLPSNLENQEAELWTNSPRQEDLDVPIQEPTFIKPEPEDFLFDIKSEPDLDFNLENLNVDTDNPCPTISVIPISRLIKSELQDLNRADIIAPTPSELLIAPTTPARRPTLKPNLVQRRKKSINDDNSGSLSENLVQRVANMDKMGIKNVINNSGTKYDAALKIQARKKLREEIRKQLKSMNFTPPENSENSVLVPDEIVDSMNIPAVVLDEIRKAFGIVLVEDMRVIPEAEKADTQPPSVTEEVTKSGEGPSKSPDLMSRLKMLEEVKSHTERVPLIKTEPAAPKKHSKSQSTEDVVVVDSSSSSSSSSSSDSDSDTSSTSTDSNTSTTSSFKRRRRKKRILEANVVGNFEKLILPNLTTAQRRRYREKYSKTTKASLLYIYGVCVSRAKNSDTVDPKEKLKLKRNLSSADNAQSLEFLMKSILNLFEHHKEKRRKDKEKINALPLKATGSKNKRSNLISPMKGLNDSTCNQGISDDEGDVEQGREHETESAVTEKSCELPKHQSTKEDDAPPLPKEGGINRNDEDSITESANSAQGVRRIASETDSDSDEQTGDGNPPSRQWKSPGEKKCIEIETPSPLSTLGMMQPPLGMNSFDLDSLKSQSRIGDEAVSSIREIDVKLMELHKRKMYIEEMILKLQKDKMEVDLWTMKLQNEKFILLNSALANASSSSNILLTPKIEKNSKKAVKRKPFSTPFSEKLRNRKKRCQRDILLEDADNAINASNPPGEGSDIAKLMLLPRRTRRDTRSLKDQAENEQTLPTETNKTDAETAAEEVVTEDCTPIKSTEVPQVDYTDVPNGNLEGWKLPITQIIVVGEAIIAASEDGNIYKFNIRTRVLESKFSKHTEAITQIFTCPKENFVYTTSLDGFLKKTSIENFGLELQSLNLQEPLQSIDIQWATAFIGSRWGNIFTYDIKKNNLSESLLCSSGSSIIAIKATKEGPRKILIVSSKGNQIHFRDALTGLLLRSLDVPDNLHIYSILLDEACIFCGTQRNEIHQYNFTTGGRLAVFQCGNGAVSMKLYKEKYIFVGCYDGFVYVLNKTTGCQLGRFPGSGKMILALEIAGDKLITSAKDNTMQIIDIPKYIVTKD